MEEGAACQYLARPVIEQARFHEHLHTLGLTTSCSQHQWRLTLTILCVEAVCLILSTSTTNHLSLVQAWKTMIPVNGRPHNRCYPSPGLGQTSPMNRSRLVKNEWYTQTH